MDKSCLSDPGFSKLQKELHSPEGQRSLSSVSLEMMILTVAMDSTCYSMVGIGVGNEFLIGSQLLIGKYFNSLAKTSEASFVSGQCLDVLNRCL